MNPQLQHVLQDLFVVITVDGVKLKFLLYNLPCYNANTYTIHRKLWIVFKIIHHLVVINVSLGPFARSV